MTDLGELSYFLGMEFLRSDCGILMHQKKYSTDTLKKFNMLNCNSAVTHFEVGLVFTDVEGNQSVDSTLYRQMVGSLRYICNSRPDLAYGVGVVSRYMEKPNNLHLTAVKRLMRYIRGTLDFGVFFPVRKHEKDPEMIGFTYAD